jgi:hypothetical protein
MREVSERLAAIEEVQIPDTVPAEFMFGFSSDVQPIRR